LSFIGSCRRTILLPPHGKFADAAIWHGKRAVFTARELPEVAKEANSYEETQIRYRARPALDGTRYSPAQVQSSGHLIGGMKVDFGDTDTAWQLTGQDHDGLIKLLGRNQEMQALATALQLIDTNLIKPHAIKNEIQRRDALLRGQVIRRGSNGYTEPVNYYRAPGHFPQVPGGTIASPQGLFGESYDPMDDILLAKDVLSRKGMSIKSMYCTSSFTSDFAKNTETKKRTNKVTVNANGQIMAIGSRPSKAEVNQMLDDEGLPPFTAYDFGYYKDLVNFERYMEPMSDRHFLLIIGSTDTSLEVTIDNEQEPLILNPIGYYGVGTNVGQADPGRTVFSEVQQRKPQGLYGESYQTGLPVIQDPDSVYVIEWLKPTP
jgi:hypothetical protein